MVVSREHTQVSILIFGLNAHHFQVAPVYFLYTFVSTAAANKVLSENWVSTEHLDCIG